jgi:hypothetical protein
MGSSLSFLIAFEGANPDSESTRRPGPSLHILLAPAAAIAIGREAMNFTSGITISFMIC